jgi:hypothetical protein
MITRALLLLSALVCLGSAAHGETILLYTAETRGQALPCPV